MPPHTGFLSPEHSASHALLDSPLVLSIFWVVAVEVVFPNLKRQHYLCWTYNHLHDSHELYAIATAFHSANGCLICSWMSHSWGRPHQITGRWHGDTLSNSSLILIQCLNSKLCTKQIWMAGQGISLPVGWDSFGYLHSGFEIRLKYQVTASSGRMNDHQGFIYMEWLKTCEQLLSPKAAMMIHDSAKENHVPATNCIVMFAFSQVVHGSDNPSSCT